MRTCEGKMMRSDGLDDVAEVGLHLVSNFRQKRDLREVLER